jgi:acylphosphatase
MNKCGHFLKVPILAAAAWRRASKGRFIVTTAMRFIVSGNVQGVFFRATTRAEAESLGLQGYAANLPDGRVEVLAVGDSSSVAKLAEWLHEGPPLATVLAVETQPADPAELSGRSGFSCG